MAFWLIQKKGIQQRNTNKPVSAIRCKCWEGILDALIVVVVKREYGKHHLWNQAHKGMASFLILSLLFISM